MRWNGWGEAHYSFEITSTGLNFLHRILGSSEQLPEAPLADAIDRVPASRIRDSHYLMTSDPEVRLRHARGQSLPDWLARKSGDMEFYPDAVAFPENRRDVKELIALAKINDWVLIPYGGGTSVVGHINVPDSERPVVTISMARMNCLQHLDETSLLATFGAGTRGPEVEAQLQVHGYTLGHFPQSFEYSTLGGWVASRSSGQQSLRYGRIEQLFAGGHVESPQGPVTLTSLPASAAASDFRQHILGSEGRLGILTDVEVRITPLPDEESFGLAFFPDWDSAVDCVRELVQQRVPLSMLRVSNVEETRTQLLLSVKDSHRQWLYRLLKVFKIGSEPCLLLYGISGSRSTCELAKSMLKKSARSNRGWVAGSRLAGHWKQNRFRTPYLRESLWQQGYLVDTLETAVRWSSLRKMMETIESVLNKTMAEFHEPLHVFSHLSHCYQDGGTIYTTYVFRHGGGYAEALSRWRKLKKAASDAIVALQGTISHQHGVGRDHKPYLVAEKGELVLSALNAEFKTFDPHGMMNPGVILD